MKKIDSFWDSSALVPLCVGQGRSVFAWAALRSRTITVWWSAPVEVAGAFSRLLRDGDMGQPDLEKALTRLAVLEKRWVEVLPTMPVRELARALLQKHPLRAADALQLGAALIWAKERPAGRPFVCLDGRLAEAARQEGFGVEAF